MAAYQHRFFLTCGLFSLTNYKTPIIRLHILMNFSRLKTTAIEIISKMSPLSIFDRYYIQKPTKMKEFVLIFRNGNNPEVQPSPEQLQQVLNAWVNWMAGIAAQNKLADKGNRLSPSDAKVVKPNNIVADGPYTEIKEFITGYVVIKAASIDEAIEMARECPILKSGGNVEVRSVHVDGE